MKCILCNDDRLKRISSLKKQEIVSLHKKIMKKDFSYIVKENLEYYECGNCNIRFFSPIFCADSSFYEKMQEFDWYYLDTKYEYEQAKRHILPEDMVLDIGSGKGAFARYIPDNEYVGIDTSSSAIEIAKNNGVLVENYRLEEFMKCNAGSFDVVVSFQVLEHVAKPSEFLENALKLLKRNGKLIIAVPSENSFLKYVTNGIFNMPPHHVSRWSDETLSFVAKQNQMELLEIHHEELQEEHKEMFLEVFFQKCFMREALLDLSFKRMVLSKLSRIVAKRISPRLEGDLLPNGHTVLAVYRKLQ